MVEDDVLREVVDEERVEAPVDRVVLVEGGVVGNKGGVSAGCGEGGRV